MTDTQVDSQLETGGPNPYRLPNALGIASGVILLLGMCLPVALAALLSLIFGMRSLFAFREAKIKYPEFHPVPKAGKITAIIACLINGILFATLAFLYFSGFDG